MRLHLLQQILASNVAYRTGKKLEWDYKNLRATNAPEASRVTKREYRGWWRDILKA